MGILQSLFKPTTTSTLRIENSSIKRLVPKCKEWKIDTLFITTSRNCPICSKYNRKIYSLYGWNRKYPLIPNEILSAKCSKCGVHIGATLFTPGINSNPKK